MAAANISRDKYDPVIIPYCKPTPSQVLILQSCPFLSPHSDVIPSSSSSSEKDAHHVFDEMPESKSDRGKRKLPLSFDKNSREGERVGECSKHDVFKDTINRVLSMLVAEGKGKGYDGKGVDFLETAKKKGMTFPRPRWRSSETWKGL